MDAVKNYLRLCWFDTNPLVLEKSTAFLKWNLLFYLVVQYFLQTNMTDDPLESFAEVIVEFVLTLSFIGVLLFVDKKRKAFIQVSTAVFFCTNVLSIFFIPVIVWLTVTDDPLSYYVMVVLFLWLYSLVTHIFKSVLVVDWLASLALSLFYFIVVYLGAVALGQL